MKKGIVSLNDLLHQLLSHFRANHPNSPANTIVFGFVTPDGEALSVTVNRERALITDGIRDAEYLIYGSIATLETVFTPDAPNRAAAVDQLEMRPNYPFNHYLLSIFLNAFDRHIPDLDYVAKPLEGVFPFPPRYPATQNPFRMRRYEPSILPIYDHGRLPQLIADDHPEWVAMYDKAWQLAFNNLRQPEPESGFIANFIDPAFNANTFMWDTCFMTMFGCYGRHAFPFIRTTDNFYAKQHDDGFICREINTFTGADLFQSLDPRSTGPNILAWTEWQDYQHSGDLDRLRAVFPVLVSYHRWWKDWRTHPDGSYWTSGWGSGMDNQTRVPRSEFHHRHYTWLDATMQQALNCQKLLAIAGAIGNDEFNSELTDEFEHLKHYVNMYLWDEASGFYYDRSRDGQLSTVKSIGVYWGLLSKVVPVERILRLIDHLVDSRSFKRPHRIPTQAYDSPDYNDYGGYWLGGVWSPTNLMVLRGLAECSERSLAYAIARNHLEQVARVYTETGTLWENYSPELAQPGRPASRDFVGWTGNSAITIPIEFVMGIQSINNGRDIQWDIHLSERHGVRNYPLGQSHEIDLLCERDPHFPPRLTIKTPTSFTLYLQWESHSREIRLAAGEHQFSLFDPL